MQTDLSAQSAESTLGYQSRRP